VKHYAKKREAVRAVQWLGELTPEVRDLIGDRAVRIVDAQQLDLGGGWYARVSDWIYSTDVSFAVISNETLGAPRPWSLGDVLLVKRFSDRVQAALTAASEEQR
jgi:hypothetical protein